MNFKLSLRPLFNAFFIVAFLVSMLPAGVAHAADQTLGDGVDPVNGAKIITVKDDGGIILQSYYDGEWSYDFYADGKAKGSRFSYASTVYKFGGSNTFKFPSATGVTASSNTKDGNAITTTWDNLGNYKVTQVVTYTADTDYYSITWSIQNNTGSDNSSGLRWITGGDTTLAGTDTGSGWVKKEDNVIQEVGVTNPGTGQKMWLKTLSDTVSHYESQSYGSVNYNANNGLLTDTINDDPATDNAYAMQWDIASLADGATWTIEAEEHMSYVPYLKSSVPAAGATVTTRPTQLTVTYNMDFLHNGTTNAANNKANYRLVFADTDAHRVTATCSASLGTGETSIAIGTVTYDSGTKTATLPVNGGTGLPNGYYRLIACGNLENTTGVGLNGDNTEATVNFVVDVPPGVTSSSPLDNATLGSGIKKITVQFDEDMLADGTEDAANYLDNYLLVMQGSSRSFGTATCSGGPSGTDKVITINSVSYNSRVTSLFINDNKALKTGKYKLLICGSTSIYNTMGSKLNNGVDSEVEFTINAGSSGGGGEDYLPATGFAPGVTTYLADQPTTREFSNPSVSIEIPSLDVMAPVVGVPLADGIYSISWLNDNIGWLDQTAFPGWQGNSVLTGHNYKADGLAGPFAALANAKYDDEIILRYSGEAYIYKVRSVNTQVAPGDTSYMGHKENSWLTLITCQGYSEASKSYRYRTVVQAELLTVK
jgi:LPXTG-site transpeptidase (sortase) family protein